MTSDCTPDDWCCHEGEGRYFCPKHAPDITALERDAIVYQQTIKGILYDKDTAENDRDVLMAKLESARRTNAGLVAALEKIAEPLTTGSHLIACAALAKAKE